MTNPNDVSQLLRQLHGTLADSPNLTEHDRELLRQLSSDIQGLLAKPGSAVPEGEPPLTARLADAVTRFEVTHPDLAGVLSGVSKVLGDMGI